jgi:hypothetical protein
MNNKEQLEMGLGANVKAQQCPRRSQQRRQRAQWWFHQMRVLVNSAVDWKPAPPARPEQTYLSLPRKTQPENS